MSTSRTARPGRDLSQVAARVEATALTTGTLTLLVIALPPTGRLWLAAWTAIALAAALVVGRAIWLRDHHGRHTTPGHAPAHRQGAHHAR